MSVILSSETESLIAERIKLGGYSTPDQVVRAALEVLLQTEASALSPGESADLRLSVDQMQRGQITDWPTLSARLREKYLPH